MKAPAVLSASAVLIAALALATAGGVPAAERSPSAQISKKKRKPPRLECPSHGDATKGNVKCPSPNIPGTASAASARSTNWPKRRRWACTNPDF